MEREEFLRCVMHTQELGYVFFDFERRMCEVENWDLFDKERHIFGFFRWRVLNKGDMYLKRILLCKRALGYFKKVSGNRVSDISKVYLIVQTKSLENYHTIFNLCFITPPPPPFARPLKHWFQRCRSFHWALPEMMTLFHPGNEDASKIRINLAPLFGFKKSLICVDADFLKLPHAFCHSVLLFVVFTVPLSHLRFWTLVFS